MKKLIIITLALLTTTLSFAQQEGDMNIGVHTGFSVTGALYRIATGIAQSDSFGTELVGGTNLPSFGASFDYGISDRFSIGALASVQHFTADINERIVNAGDTSFRLNPVDAKFNRIYIGIVPKYLYETGNDNFEMYSAIRAGFILWQGNFDVENSNIDAFEGIGGGRPSLSLVAIGGRYFLAPNVALNFEVATGAPALLTLGVNIKL